MMKRDSHIINVSSESVDLPFPHLSVYQSSKAGLERFSLSLYRELDASGIRVSHVRAGQMFEEGKTWDVDPDAAMKFHQAALAMGINLGERPISRFTSVTSIFRALIDLPADLHAVTIGLHARKAQ
jgi:meso-butanediol dehydrogenase/(S,S)-butanediol dehydrogenase/diacetyl reductase